MSRLLLTNWHVFHNPERAANSYAEFNYTDIRGRPPSPRVMLTPAPDEASSARSRGLCLGGGQPLQEPPGCLLTNLSRNVASNEGE